MKTKSFFPKNATRRAFMLMLVVAMVLGFNSAKAQDWQLLLPQPQGNSLNCIKFVNANTGFAVGGLGTIIKTSNAGTNWTILPSGTYENLRSIFFTDENTGYIVGDNGTILKTANGGNTWFPQNSNTLYNLNSVFFVGNTGYAAGDGEIAGEYGGVLLKTTNGGANWLPLITDNPFTSIFFTDANTGYAINGNWGITKTTNGGNDWTYYESGYYVMPKCIYFTDDNTGYIVGIGGINGVISSDYELLKTTDAGLTWNSITVTNTVGYAQLNSVCFPSSNIGYAVGVYGAILKTTDSGATWTNQTGVYDNFNSCYFTDDNTGYAVGVSGTIIKTTDGGINWTNLSVPGHSLWSVYFTDINNGYGVGSSGKIVKTTDGGLNWTIQNSGTTNHLTSVNFANENVGYTVGANGTILKTEDGGLSWTSQIPGTLNNLSSVFFTDELNGCAVGANGTILKTVNGGSTWSIINSGTSNSLRSVFFTDSNIGYTVGASGTILKTIDGGSNWTIQTSGTLNNLTSVFFTDSNIGYTVGANGTILKTTDGGSSWSSQTSGTLKGLLSVFFTNANTGYTVGASGTILKTNDGGLNWISQTSGTIRNINSVYFPAPNVGYAVGIQVILKTNNCFAISTPNLSVTQNSDFTVDINTSQLNTSNGIFSYQFRLTYNPLVVEYVNNSLIGTIGDGGFVIVNPISSGLLMVSYYTSTALNGTGSILKLKFKALCGTTTPAITDFLYNTKSVCSVTNGTIDINYTCGNIDADSIIGSFDASLADRYSILLPTPPLPQPWTDCQINAANVSGGILSSYDAGLISQYVAGLITVFPGCSSKKTTQSTAPVADVTVNVVGDELVFTAYGELIGLNISVNNGNSLLGTPVVLDNHFMLEFNISDSTYLLALSTAYPPASGTVFMKIPYKQNPNVSFDMLINEVVKTVPTGIEDINPNKFSVFPNPVNNQLIISGIETPTTVTITSVNGSILKTLNLTENTEIDVSNLSAGVYFIRFQSDENVSVQRFVKQ